MLVVGLERFARGRNWRALTFDFARYRGREWTRELVFESSCWHFGNSKLLIYPSACVSFFSIFFPLSRFCFSPASTERFEHKIRCALSVRCLQLICPLLNDTIHSFAFSTIDYFEVFHVFDLLSFYEKFFI